MLYDVIICYNICMYVYIYVYILYTYIYAVYTVTIIASHACNVVLLARLRENRFSGGVWD